MRQTIAKNIRTAKEAQLLHKAYSISIGCPVKVVGDHCYRSLKHFYLGRYTYCKLESCKNGELIVSITIQ